MKIIWTNNDHSLSNCGKGKNQGKFRNILAFKLNVFKSSCSSSIVQFSRSEHQESNDVKAHKIILKDFEMVLICRSGKKFQGKTIPGFP